MKMPGWPHFDEQQIQAVVDVLSSGEVNYWTGELGRTFEKRFAEYSGCRYGVALANGTVALELALLARGIGPGDEVVVTPRTFLASANCALLRGATPVFADVDRVSQNITAESIRKVLTPRTRAIVAVHLSGWPCEMDSIVELARERKLHVIEDCAQAHGATYRGRPVGSLGDVAAFSFCQDKIMTTGGEGGMLVTDDEAVWRKVWEYKDHGKSYDAVYNREHVPGFRWLHESLGTNYRMTEMQAALGLVQLDKVGDWVDRRRANAARLSEGLAPLAGLRLAEPPEHIRHSYYRYYANVRPERLRDGWHRDRIMNEIVERGVPCFSGICGEVYLEKVFQRELDTPQDRLPVARELGETSLAFLVHPTLGPEQMDHTCHVVNEVLKEATA